MPQKWPSQEGKVKEIYNFIKSVHFRHVSTKLGVISMGILFHPDERSPNLSIHGVQRMTRVYNLICQPFCLNVR